MLSHIQRIEIELHSYCNRNCSWCPNSKLDRKFYKEMPEETYLKLLYELKDNNFGAYCKSSESYMPTFIAFNRFSETMYNTTLLKKRVNQARDILGKVLFVVNTNGDFLSNENLNDLYLDNLQIMDYDCIGKEEAIKKLKSCNVLILDVDNYIKGCIVGIHNTVSKILYFYDWPLNAQLEDRAGFLKNDIVINQKNNALKLKFKNDKQLRNYPCIEPSYFVSIDYDGFVTPCCHIRSDYEPHKKYALGNIKDQSLIDILNSQQWINFKNLVSSNDFSNYPDICKHCHKTR